MGEQIKKKDKMIFLQVRRRNAWMREKNKLDVGMQIKERI